MLNTRVRNLAAASESHKYQKSVEQRTAIIQYIYKRSCRQTKWFFIPAPFWFYFSRAVDTPSLLFYIPHFHQLNLSARVWLTPSTRRTPAPQPIDLFICAQPKSSSLRQTVQAYPSCQPPPPPPLLCLCIDLLYDSVFTRSQHQIALARV